MKATGLLPLIAALLSLLGSLGATLTLHHSASTALERELDERLHGTGAAAAVFFARFTPTDADLRELMTQNNLDGAYVVSPDLRITADAGGDTGGKVDLLRVDLDRLQAALAGRGSVGLGYSVGDLLVGSAYFPIRSGDMITGALGLEAGRSFTAAKTTVVHARNVSVVLSLLAALALGIMGTRWVRLERLRLAAVGKAARGEALAAVAATAAHEIRNPLGVIRGTIELMRERSAQQLSERDRSALTDIMGEVERLKRLTDDLLDLSADRPLTLAPVDLAQLLETTRQSFEAGHPSLRVRCESEAASVRGDASRLRQVLLNLLVNAAQAQGEGEITLSLSVKDGYARVSVRDQGPGVSPEARQRLFEPFVTGKSHGTGLGLAVSRRLIERHQGTLRLIPTDGRGALFEIQLPLA
ncbi:MAG: sensor histidine kinase [Myxococcaceae bacterium]